jgi:hypothetical protein
MIQITFITVTAFAQEAEEVASRALARWSEYTASWCIRSNEPYWKLEGYYRTTCNVHTKQAVDRHTAEILLQAIADKWYWAEDGSSAVADDRQLDSEFVDNRISFVSCWFEDLEE